MITVGIFDIDDEIRHAVSSTKNKKMLVTGENEIILATRTLEYNPGDYIKVSVSEKNTFLCVKLDETFDESMIYFGDTTEFIYKIPFGTEKEVMKDTAFLGKSVLISARYPNESEIKSYQNLSKNRHALDFDQNIYPFASTNSGTSRPAFMAKNAIDGIYANDDHGVYPYQSWGTNQKDDAELKIEFGRDIKVNKLGITLRADFPHDIYWKNLTVYFSDDTEIKINLEKTSKTQYFDIEQKEISWVVVKNLIKGEEGDFAALTQFELWGYNL
ncbi:hypothetical protein [Helcococcus bovis]|uniref:hypothetical protein n=1 Tax=Helcococcus bovis TaxID=3153252 RepID=UPI0038B6F969